MQVINQKPSPLEPSCTDSLSKDLDADLVKAQITEIFAPLRTPLAAAYGQSTAQFLDDKGNDITDDDIANTFLRCCQDTVDVDAEGFMQELFAKTLPAYDKLINADSVFLAQDNATAKCPVPSARVIYTPDDLKDACRKYLQDPAKNLEFLRCTEGFVFPERHAGAGFLVRPVFDAFKAHMKTIVQNTGQNLSPDTVKKFQDFDSMNLDCIEGILLRSSDADGLNPWSFERVFMEALKGFAKMNPDTVLFTPYVSELVIPKNLLFIDIEAVSRASKTKLNRCINDIKGAMQMKLNVTNLSSLRKMSSVAQNQRKMAAQLANSMSAAKSEGKRALFRFRRKPVSKTDLSKNIAKIVKKEVNVACSENYTKVIKSSYQRPNRRNPDNFNLKGKSISLAYKPDIHIYLDTSGSISEDNYQQAILTCIRMAKALNVNLYFNSFSHTISGCAKLKTAGQTVMGCYKEFQKVPKVDGGTNYWNVWNYIMASPKRRREISLMITDFEYTPPSGRVEHPPKLYYAPIDVSAGNWKYITKYAERFCKSMFHIDGNIRKKILF